MRNSMQLAVTTNNQVIQFVNNIYRIIRKGTDPKKNYIPLVIENQLTTSDSLKIIIHTTLAKNRDFIEQMRIEIIISDGISIDPLAVIDLNEDGNPTSIFIDKKTFTSPFVIRDVNIFLTSFCNSYKSDSKTRFELK